MKEPDKSIQHTSFGMMRIARVYTGGGQPFFGTDMQPNSYIQIEVSQNATMEYDEVMGCKPWASSKRTDEVVKLRMTSTQFAELITTLNIGMGVPCTIERVSGMEVPQYYETLQSSVNYEAEKLEKKLKSYGSRFAEASSRIEELTSALPKCKKAEISKIISQLSTDICSNTPYHLHCFEEAVEKTVTKAKSEIANYLSIGSNIVRLEAMRGREDAINARELTKGITYIKPQITDNEIQCSE